MEQQQKRLRQQYGLAPEHIVTDPKILQVPTPLREMLSAYYNNSKLTKNNKKSPKIQLSVFELTFIRKSSRIKDNRILNCAISLSIDERSASSVEYSKVLH
jgi:hypothetical protein